MTREEAIDILIREKDEDIFMKTEYRNKIHEALNMAIKSLEQELCEDSVSREAVNILVDELARAISDERCCMPRGRSTASIMQDILDLPTVQQKTDILDKIRNEITMLISFNRKNVIEIIDKYREEE